MTLYKNVLHAVLPVTAVLAALVMIPVPCVQAAESFSRAASGGEQPIAAPPPDRSHAM